MADTILDRLEEYTQRDPLAPILFDEVYTKGITYHQLDEMSGRVYAWLKREGIGREDRSLESRCRLGPGRRHLSGGQDPLYPGGLRL